MIGAISHDLVHLAHAHCCFKIETAEPALRASVGTDIDQMEAMISGVLSFVRDASYARDRTAVDLLSVLECAIDDARASGAETELSSSDQPTVDGDALALRRLFANLIDNAVKYGHRVRIHLYMDGATAVAEVADDGPGLPSGELERVFEPLPRRAVAQSRDRRDRAWSGGRPLHRPRSRRRCSPPFRRRRPDRDGQTPDRPAALSRQLETISRAAVCRSAPRRHPPRARARTGRVRPRPPGPRRRSGSSIPGCNSR